MHAQRPCRQVLRRGGRGPGGAATAQVHPHPAQRAAWPGSAVWTAPPAARTTPPHPRPCGWCHPRTPAARPRQSAWGQGPPDRATHQVLQSTLILSPGEYRSLLCTHGHSSSTTHPPRPSSISPSGQTQPLTHSVWYCRGRRAGFRPRWPSRPFPCPLSSRCRHPFVPSPPRPLPSLLSRAHTWAGRRRGLLTRDPCTGPEPSGGWAGAPRDGRASAAQACEGPASRPQGQ